MHHFEQIAMNPLYSGATVYVYIENNMSAITADDWSDKIREGCKGLSLEFIFVDKDPSCRRKAGIRTDDVLKEAYVKDFEHRLGSGRIHIAENFISGNSAAFLKKTETQLNNYQRIPRMQKNAGNTMDVTVKSFRYTGKLAGMPDDIGFIFMMLPYQALEMIRSHDYQSKVSSGLFPY